ncbi:MAG: DUF1080 domain-containing protein [Saprospiraceae bacterium]|nr:DUF1080 domain-containing protein [Saprospiraceae bacterium]
MHNVILLFLYVGGMATFMPQDNWQHLFNAKNLEGWEVKGAAESNFFVEDGILVAETKLGLPNTFLATTKEYEDFELEVEFWVPDGINTGVQIRSDVYSAETTTPYLNGKLEASERTWEAGRVHGYQIEIDPSARAWTGGFYEEGGRGWLVPLSDNEQARQAFKNNDWNHFRIMADGKHFKSWINGVMAVDTHDDMAVSGFIALQLHSIKNQEQEGKQIRWRNIRIKEL